MMWTMVLLMAPNNPPVKAQSGWSVSVFWTGTSSYIAEAIFTHLDLEENGIIKYIMNRCLQFLVKDYGFDVWWSVKMRDVVVELGSSHWGWGGSTTPAYLYFQGEADKVIF